MNVRFTLLRLLTAAGMLAALSACGSPTSSTPAPKPANLAGMTVQPQVARREQAWDGVVEAVNQATMFAQTSGRVIELPYDVNDYVKAGEVIVRFTDVEQKSVRRQAQAQLASAKAAYNEAESSYRRISEVYARKLVSKADYEQAVARRDAAKAALNSAQAGLREVGQKLDYTTVRAPYEGYVTKRWVHVGEAVQPGQPLISGISLKQMRVTVQVPQSAMGAIRKFHSAEIVLNGNDGQRVKASKVTIFPYADPQTHTFDVRLELDGEHTGLYPGMTVKVAFAVGETRRILVPASALWHQGEVTGIFVLDKSGVSLRQVRTGDRFGDRVEVLSGLVAGERIATDPTAASRYLSTLNSSQST